MQRKSGRLVRSALASLTILIPGCLIAAADGVKTSPNADPPPPQCGAADQGLRANKDPVGCARIRGYVAAGSDFIAGEKIGGRPEPFEHPAVPIVSSVGSLEPAPGGAPPRAPFLKVSHDDGVR